MTIRQIDSINFNVFIDWATAYYHYTNALKLMKNDGETAQISLQICIVTRKQISKWIERFQLFKVTYILGNKTIYKWFDSR